MVRRLAPRRDPMRYPAKANLLRSLREIGVEIGTILDVGAHAQTAELRTQFPDRRHLLFEPATEFHAQLAANYAGIEHEVIGTALSDRDGTGNLHKMSNDGRGISHTTLVGPGFVGVTEPVPTARLDTILAGRNDPKPFLLKVDVDGAEMPVLAGAEGIWPDVACVIVEATVAAFAERLNLVLSKGFRLFDIVDACYYLGQLAQVDLVFLAERLYARPELRRAETTPFAHENWIPMAHFEPVVLQSAATTPIYVGSAGAAARDRRR